MKKIFILGIVLLVSAFAFSAMAAPKAPNDGLVMEKTSKKVIFNHSTHSDAACGACHHPVNGAEDYRQCGSAGCHDNFDQKDKTSVNSYYRVMHTAKGTKFDTCVSCHAKAIKAGADKAKFPSGCAKSSCHPTK
ncbi:cytochrome c3 family protein [Desulfovibrio sp. OttesenSCG-928-C14]|nr:cytochrome c3 family protein [Desulfovibrio sp. OttesenSCG-928-C14]